MKVAIYSLSKSGHNAIANWILAGLNPNFDYSVCHYDTLNPSNTYYVSKDRLGIDSKQFLKTENTFMILEDFDILRQTVEADIQILILRDYPNFWASLYKFIKDNPMHRDMLRIDFGKMWHEYYEEFIGRTRIFNEQLITISYNDWFQSPHYRELVFGELSRLRMPMGFPPQGLGTVTKQGYGSSFDGFEYQHSPQKMNVLTRYKYLMKDPEYQKNLKENMQNVADSQRTFRIKNPFDHKIEDTPLSNFTEEHFQSFFNKE